MKTFQYYCSRIQLQRTTMLQIKKMTAFFEKNPELLADAFKCFDTNEPELYRPEMDKMILFLKKVWKGESGITRRDHPFKVEDMHHIKNADKILLVGFQVESAHRFTFVRPVFQIVTTKGVKGFMFYIAADKPVIIRKKLKPYVLN